MNQLPQTQPHESSQFQVIILEQQHENSLINSQNQKNQTQFKKNTNRSLRFSMIEDDGILSDYFLNDMAYGDKKDSPQNKKQQKIFRRKVNQLEDLSSSIQKDMELKFAKKAQQNSQNQIALHKRGFHYESAKRIQQSQGIIHNEILHNYEQKNISRLEIEKEKYNLNFEQVYGQIFIYIAECELIGYKKEEYGYFLVTNYRVIFFQFIPELDQTRKRVDLPFGFVKKIEYQQKRKEVIFHLHYNHFWKFCFVMKENFEKINFMLDIYAKTKNLKQSFAFSYALKTPEFKKSNFSILKLYARMNLKEASLIFPNEGFKLSDSYPPYICLPRELSNGSLQTIKSICQNFKGNLLPILTFKYGKKQLIGLWLSGAFVEDKKLNQKQLKTYYSFINGNKREILHVYNCYSKPSKGLVESHLDKKIENHWLDLWSNAQIKTSYNLMVRAYLTPGKSFYSDIISSKWYEIIVNLLKYSFEISEKLFNHEHVLIKQDETRQKSLIISALVQIILEPFYRTFNGFKDLVMKEFVCLGYKFSSRLGNKDPSDECPTFIIFLDAVHQLINLNPLYFEFNSKYLGKLSNLMYTNIFGTFLADSPKQFFQYKILEQTIEIWPSLENDLGTNPFYEIKSGILAVKPYSLNNIELWTEHFGYLISPPKDHYKMNILAESTSDYLSLECLKVKKQNKQLKYLLEKQKQQINRLKDSLEVKKKQGIQNKKLYSQ